MTRYASLDYLVRVRGNRGRQPLWTQRSAKRIARALDLEVRSNGALPRSGLLVCNHVSYLDIVALATVGPVVFVSKSEVRNWPLFGQLAKWAGTIFVRRDSRTDVARVNELSEPEGRRAQKLKEAKMD